MPLPNYLGMKDGSQYFFGDALNQLLFGTATSIWSLTGGAARAAGYTQYPDINELMGHVSGTLGKETSGVPRVPDQHKPHDLPLNFLTALWPKLQPTILMFCPDPVLWPVLHGFAIQKAVDEGKSVLDPTIAFKLVMECAAPMSAVDLSSDRISIEFQKI